MSISIQNRFTQLRINDLIAKVAHVRIKDALRVLIALRAVSEEYELPISIILNMPYSADKPTPEQVRDCEHAYWWMYDNPHLNNLLSEIEQYV